MWCIVATVDPGVPDTVSSSFLVIAKSYNLVVVTLSASIGQINDFPSFKDDIAPITFLMKLEQINPNLRHFQFSFFPLFFF